MMPPVPRDIPLPLPAPRALLEALLILAFSAHIFFVNLTVGSAVLVLGFEIRGRKERDFDRLARALAATVTVNKSLAVVLGVAPLLLLSVLFTIHFYTANALTGSAWLLVVPAVAAVFMLFYLHKYSWDRLAEAKGVHIGIQAVAVGILLLVPLVFIGDTALMLYPERWTETRGFLSVLSLPEVMPRYFHFLCASLILTSLFGVAWFGRARYPVEATFESFDRARLRRVFYSIAFTVSLLQFVVGPVLLFTLPSQGMHWTVVTAILLGAAAAVPAVWMMWREITSETASHRLPLIATSLTLTVLCMASGRHMFRGVALLEHRRAMEAATEKWIDDSAQAAYDAEHGRALAARGQSPGEELFRATCSGCHGVDKRIVGPPMTEIAAIYAGNPEGIVRWATAPGKKREGFPQMPAFAALGDEKLGRIARYMIETGEHAAAH
jgi:cytochrome c